MRVNLLGFLTNPIVLFLEIRHVSNLCELVFFQSVDFMLQSLRVQLGIGDALLLDFYSVIQLFQFVVELSESCAFFLQPCLRFRMLGLHESIPRKNHVGSQYATYRNISQLILDLAYVFLQLVDLSKGTSNRGIRILDIIFHLFLKYESDQI